MPDRDLMNVARQFVQDTRTKRELQKELKAIEENIACGQELLLDGMEEGRFPNQARVDGATIHIKRRVTVSPRDGDYALACDALEAAGLADYSQRRFNAQSMAAYIREQQDLDQPLPAVLENALNISEVFTLGMTSA